MNKTFTKIEKIILVIWGGIVGLLVGALVRLLVLPTMLDSQSGLLSQYLPWMFGASILVGALSYLFPRFGSAIIEMITGIELGS